MQCDGEGRRGSVYLRGEGGLGWAGLGWGQRRPAAGAEARTSACWRSTGWGKFNGFTPALGPK